MTRARLRWGLAGVLLGSCLMSGALAETVIVIKDKDITPYNQAISGLREACGSAATIEELDLDLCSKEGRDPAADVSAKSPALIVTVGRESADLIAKKIPNSPIVFCMNPDPEASFTGRANAVGIALNVPPRAQFEALVQVAASTKQIGVVYCQSDLEPIVQEGKSAAQALGLGLIVKRVANAGEVPVALKEMVEGIQAIWVLPYKIMITPEMSRTLILMSVDYGRPLLAYSTDFVRKGALLAVFPDFTDTGKKAGDLVKGILQGKTAAELSPVMPTNLWALNLNMAQRLNIQVTDAIKKKASIVIE